MRSNRKRILLQIGLSVMLAWSGAAALFNAAPVLVESVAEGSLAVQAGIGPGDLLVSWARSAEGEFQPLTSPFRFLDVEIEYGPRGTVWFQGLRDGEPFTAKMPRGKWGLVVGGTDDQAVEVLLRATGSESHLEESVRLRLKDLAARALFKERDFKGAIEVAGETVGRREELHPDSLSLAFSLSTLGVAKQYSGDLDAAVVAHERALEIRKQQAPGSLAEADSLVMLGMVANVRGLYKEATEFCRAALKIHDELAPGSPELGRNLMWAGAASRGQGDLDTAEALLGRAVQVQRRVAPDSTDLASSLDQLGIVLRYRGDLDGAEELVEGALAIHKKLAPGGGGVAAALNSLGILAVHRGDLAAAQARFAESMAIRQRLTPGGLRVAGILNNLGYVAMERGDLITAEKYFRDALEIYEKESPGSVEITSCITNLGVVAAKRGDLALAEKRYQEVLAFTRSEMPDSFDLTIALANVGNTALERDEFPLAEKSFREAAAIHAKLNPDSMEAANNEMGFGHLARKRGDLMAAEAHYRKSLSIQKKNSPAGIKVADSLYQLGRLAYKQGKLEQAEESLQASLAISRRLMPGSMELADASHLLGQIYRNTERTALAVSAFGETVESLEAQRSRLGGSQETRTGWAATYAEYFRNYIDLLVTEGRPEEAFDALERSHARGLLAMLAERDLVLRSDIPEKLERRRLAVHVRHDAAQQQMMQLDAEQNQAEIEELVKELQAVNLEREEVISAIRLESPRLASLRYPEPLDLAGARRALDPGTVLLAYSTGQERTVLFVLQAVGGPAAGSGLEVFELPVGREALNEKMDAFRAGVRQQQMPGAQPLTELSRELYEILIRPAEKVMEQGERILISPDGPLHTLPFNALIRGTEEGATQYLIEWKALHTVVSATVYRELKEKRKRDQAGKETLAAFGDPHSKLARLEWSRKEVESIGEMFGEQARVFVGRQATEEKAMTESSGVNFVHFATHAVLDERFPLNSALALSVPENWVEGRPNGMLQAWEIFESLRLQADLVTLSGCETALGRAVEGEGLNSLTRAFIYAGAQSVLASLWSVADRSTSELMTRFYTHLNQGMSKDEALRAAQISLLRSGDPGPDDSGTRGVRRLARSTGESSHPYHWAAFQLVGDWR